MGLQDPLEDYSDRDTGYNSRQVEDHAEDADGLGLEVEAHGHRQRNRDRQGDHHDGVAHGDGEGVVELRISEDRHEVVETDEVGVSEDAPVRHGDVDGGEHREEGEDQEAEHPRQDEEEASILASPALRAGLRGEFVAIHVYSPRFAISSRLSAAISWAAA